MYHQILEMYICFFRQCNIYWYNRWNVFINCRLNHQCNNRCYQSINKHSRNLYCYLYHCSRRRLQSIYYRTFRANFYLWVCIYNKYNDHFFILSTFSFFALFNIASIQILYARLQWQKGPSWSQHGGRSQFRNCHCCESSWSLHKRSSLLFYCWYVSLSC